MDKVEKYIGEAKPVYVHKGDDKLVSLRQKGMSIIELKIMTMDDLINDTPLPKLKTVAKGTKDEIEDFAKKKGLIWKNSQKLMFGGYWYDKKNGEAYMPY